MQVSRCRPLAAVLALLGLLSLDPLSAAEATATAAATTAARPAAAGELLVKFKAQASTTARAQKHAREGSRRLREFRQSGVEHVALAAGQTVDAALARYRADPNVEYAEPNYKVHATLLPNEPGFVQQWALNNTGQIGGLAGADIKAPAAWDRSTGSANVVVVVLDSGIDYNHPDLVGNVWTNAVEVAGNNLDDDSNGYVDDIHGYNPVDGNGDPVDVYGHGTHMAGIIGATGNNALGVVGVNWNVRIASCKALDDFGDGTVANILSCLDYARSLKTAGYNVVATSNSYGAVGGFSQAMRDTIAAQRDILFVTGSGNTGLDNDSTDFYPANYDLPNIISVAATDASDLAASFTHVGRRTVHLGAPGANILSTLPGSSYSTASGTSMSAAYVTGVAALLKAQDGTRDWRAIKNLILSGAAANTSLTGKTITGRRLDAAGATACVNRPLLSALKVPAAFTAGVPTVLSALSINCAAASGPVTATASNGAVVTLRDDGVAPDQAAGDGIFTANWTPTAGVSYVDFSSPAGTERVGAPDLTVPLLTVPASVAAGGSFTASITAANTGSRPAAATTVSLYRSVDGVITTTDTLLGSVAVPALAAGAQQVLSLPVTLPATTVAGNYFVGAIIDPANTVAEASEANNLSAARVLSVTVAAKPADLTVTALSAPSTITRGRSITVSGTVRNAGLGAAAASTLGIYLSTDAVITGTDTLLATVAVPALAAGASSAFSGTLIVPTTVAAGRYRVGAIADSANVVLESNETNNTRATATVTVR
ncbi:CARDB domain-containing protein,subtilase family protease [Burkholderiales bacterium JOSHI_001]|nr:CARDB domain-containing protein,subtilase family protease [Burkholderiales bacterium JOSHI_001]